MHKNYSAITLKNPKEAQMDFESSLAISATENTDILLANFSLTDEYIFHQNVSHIIVLKNKVNISYYEVIMTNNTIFFLNSSANAIVERAKSYAVGDINNDSWEDLILLYNNSVEIYSGEGKILSNFTVDSFDGLIVGSSNGSFLIICWVKESNKIGVYYANGSQVNVGYLCTLNYEDLTIDIDAISILDAIYYDDHFIFHIKYTNTTEKHVIGYIENPYSANNYTLRCIDPNVSKREIIFKSVFKGKAYGNEAIYAAFYNESLALKFGIYNLTHKISEIDITDSSFKELVSTGSEFLTVSDMDNDNFYEIVVGNQTHVGRMITNSSTKIKYIEHKNALISNDSIIVVYNSSKAVLLNASNLNVAYYTNPLSDYLAWMDVIDGNIIGICRNGTRIVIKTSTFSYYETKIPFFNFIDYKCSYDSIALFSDKTVVAKWIGEGTIVLHENSWEIVDVYISKFHVGLKISNGSILVYNKSAYLVSKINMDNVKFLCGLPDSNNFFLAFNNGTLLELSTTRKVIPRSILDPKPKFLDMVNGSLLYTYVGREGGTNDVNATILLLNTTDLEIEWQTYVIAPVGIPIFNLDYFDADIAVGDVNNDSKMDLGIISYAGVSSGSSYYSSYNITLFDNIRTKVKSEAESLSLRNKITYLVMPRIHVFNDAFAIVNESEDLITIHYFNGSVKNLYFADEKPLAACKNAIITNRTLMVIHNGDIKRNVSILANTTRIFSTIYEKELFIYYPNIEGVPRLTKLSAIKDVDLPQIIEIRMPQRYNESDLIYSSSEIGFEIVLWDDVNLENCTIVLNGSKVFTFNVSGRNYVLKTTVKTGFSDGRYSLKIILQDSVGRINDNYYFYLIIDSVNPIINMPSILKVNSTHISVDVSFNDPYFDYAMYWIDGEYGGEINELYKTLNIQLEGEGEHELKVIAWDYAGNSAEKYCHIIVDMTDPNIIISAPSNNSVINQTEIVFIANISDNMNISSVRVLLNGNPVREMYPYNESISISMNLYLSSGSNVIEVVAKDHVNNVYQIRIEIIVDLISPSIDVSYNFITNETTVPLNISIKDNVGISYTCIYVNESLYENFTESEKILELQLMDEGKYVIKIVSIDKAGNVAVKEIEMIKDATAPEIYLVYPANNSVIYEQVITISFTISEKNNLSKVLIIIDNYQTLEVEKSTVSLNITLEYGEHTIKIIAIDEAGNKAELKLVVIVKQQTVEANYYAMPPQIVMGALAIFGNLTGLLIVMIIRYKRRGG